MDMKSLLSLDEFLEKMESSQMTTEDEMEMESPAETETETEEIEMMVEPSEETESEDDDDDKEEEDKDDDDDDDEEIESAGEMAYGQLERCIDYSRMLRDRIKPGDEIEPWIAAKITKSMDYLQSVFNYLDGKDGQEEVEEGEE